MITLEKQSKNIPAELYAFATSLSPRFSKKFPKDNCIALAFIPLINVHMNQYAMGASK